jgi:hypothetical protein
VPEGRSGRTGVIMRQHAAHVTKRHEPCGWWPRRSDQRRVAQALPSFYAFLWDRVAMGKEPGSPAYSVVVFSLARRCPIGSQMTALVPCFTGNKRGAPSLGAVRQSFATEGNGRRGSRWTGLSEKARKTTADKLVGSGFGA